MIAKRTRTGCLCCRRRHKKCDEMKPSCKFCLSKGMTCEWPKKGSVFVNYQSNQDQQVPILNPDSMHAFALENSSFGSSGSNTQSRKRSSSAPKPSFSTISFENGNYNRDKKIHQSDNFNPNYSVNTSSPSPRSTTTTQSSFSTFQLSPKSSNIKSSRIPDLDPHSPKSQESVFPQNSPAYTNYTFNTSITPSPIPYSPENPMMIHSPDQYLPLQQQKQLYNRQNSLPPLKDIYTSMIPYEMKHSRSTSSNNSLPDYSPENILGIQSFKISSGGTDNMIAGSNQIKRFSVDSLLN